MKFTTAALVVVLSMFVPFGAGAQGHLPEPCTKSPNPPSSAFQCPTPYVEMVATERDLIFDRAWHCRETQHSLGRVRGENACGGWQGMFDGWELPVESVAGSADLRAEIMEHVVDPCYLDMALRNPVEGVSPKQLAELTKMVTAKSVNEMVESLHPLVIKLDELEQRRVFYAMGKKICIDAARAGG